MPTNRNALLRYQIIDSCLTNTRRKWTWNDIRDAVNQVLVDEGFQSVGKTTIFQDLKDIEYIYKCEIEKTSGNTPRSKFLRYKDPDFSIRKQPLSEAETEQIKSALQVLGRFKGLPQFEWIHEVMALLESKMGFISQPDDVISFDHNEDYEGLQFISPFFNAILHKRVLNVTYKDFKNPTEYQIEFHPYHLKQYNSRWYVFGKSPTYPQHEIMNLALDRVLSTDESSIAYNKTAIDWNDYFSDIIGVTKNAVPPVNVKILIKDEEQAAYIKTKPLHQSQKTIKKEAIGFTTSIKIIPNYELIKLLLSFGGRIEVLEPEDLRNKLKEQVKKMNDSYNL